MIVVVAILVIVVDQLSKLFLSHYLTVGKSIVVIKHCFHLTLVHNTGIAFGMLKGKASLIFLVTLAGLMFIAYYLRKDYFNSSVNRQRIALYEKIAIGFVIGGAIANMIDRLRFGYVIDFLDFRIWPVFNIADSCITVGAFILMFKIFFPSRPH